MGYLVAADVSQNVVKQCPLGFLENRILSFFLASAVMAPAAMPQYELKVNFESGRVKLVVYMVTSGHSFTLPYCLKKRAAYCP